MLVLALVGESWAKNVGEAVAAGADAVLLTGDPGKKEVADAIAQAEGRPCGLLASGADADRVSQLRDAGIDFVVLDPQGPATPLQDEKMTFLLHVGQEITDMQLRTLDALPLAALYVEMEPASPTILNQIELQRFSSVARRPLLVRVPADVQQHDLPSFRDAGVGMVAVDTKERGASDVIRRLRDAIETLPRRRRRLSEGGVEISLPKAAGNAEDLEEEEEE